MLEAIARGKLPAGSISEDAFTSSVFSPMRMFSPDTIWQVVTQALINRKVYPDVLRAFVASMPAAAEIKLWPRLCAPTHVAEPDALITLNFPGIGRLGVLIEVKWASPLGFLQITRQRCAMAGDPEHQDYTHVLSLLLLRSRGQANDKTDPSLNKSLNEIVITTWAEFAHRLQMLDMSGQKLFEFWRDELVFALNRTEGPPFSNFVIARTLNLGDRSCSDWHPVEFSFSSLLNVEAINWAIKND